MENLMSYDEFINYCVECIATVLRSEYEVSANKIHKTDEWVVDSFFITKKGEDKVKRIITVPTKEYYSEYAKGEPIGEVILKVIKETEEIAGENTDFINKVTEDLQNMSDRGFMKDKLIIRPLSHTKNQKLLKDYYFRKIGDIALVLYMDAGSHRGGVMSVKISLETMKDWDKERAFETALENTAKKNTPVFYSFETAIAMGKDSEIPSRRKHIMDRETYRFKESFTNSYRLSTELGVNGAAAAFYPGVLDRVAEVLDDDLYLCFASTLECIVHPVKKSDKAFLKRHSAEMSKDTRFTPAREFLSGLLYVYCRKNAKVEVAD